MPPVVTEARFREGRTIEEYLAFIGTPENLARQNSGGVGSRLDRSAELRTACDACELTEDQHAALEWLAAQPEAPARILAIVEEWSSDCRRDIPSIARIAEALGAELHVFTRDGAQFSDAHVPSLADSPDSNADLTVQFLNEKRGEQWQSIPVFAFFTAEMRYLYHYSEMPSVFDKDRIVTNQDAVFHDDPAAWTSLLGSPFFRVWQCAAVDEMVSALHRVALLGQA
ncbi:MAG: hypothetical protein DWI48_00370 [Chloroflexi bacterium]|nr:MAG: hypothetical protein DWI48_00370 [Chloroflexota bacterium]